MNKENNKKLISALNQAAKDHKIIQGNHNELARLAKMNQPTITRILNGQTSDPRISSILQIAEACGVKPWELISDAQARNSIKDEKLLATIIDDVETVFSEKNIPLPTIKKAKVISIIYNRYIGQAVRPARFKAEVIELFDLVA